MAAFSPHVTPTVMAHDVAVLTNSLFHELAPSTPDAFRAYTDAMGTKRR